MSTRKKPSTSPSKKEVKEPSKEVKLMLQKIELLEVENESLKRELIMAKEQSAATEVSRNDLRARLAKCYRELEDERSSKNLDETDMRNQYSMMQREIQVRNNELNQQLEDMIAKLEKSHATIEEMKKQKEIELAKKDSIIADQARKMEHMATEFSDMLNETLQKMSERIELKMNERKFIVMPEAENPPPISISNTTDNDNNPTPISSGDEFTSQRYLIQKSLSRLKNTPM